MVEPGDSERLMKCLCGQLHGARGSGNGGQMMSFAVYCLDVLSVRFGLRKVRWSCLRSVVASECGVRMFRGGGGPMLRLCSGLIVGVSNHGAVVGCGATTRGRAMAEAEAEVVCWQNRVPGGCSGSRYCGGSIGSLGRNEGHEH
jgi:hypothetical protein